MLLETKDKAGSTHRHPAQQQLKYLCYMLDETLSIEPCARRLVQKASYAMSGIRKAFRNLRNVLAISHIKLTKSLALSRFNYYGVFLETANTVHAARGEPTPATRLRRPQNTYRSILRSMLCAPASTPIPALHLLADMPSLTDWLQSECAKYWSRLLHIPQCNPLYALIDNYWYRVWGHGAVPRLCADDVPAPHTHLALLTSRQEFRYRERCRTRCRQHVQRPL